jgi:hypothetical protein
MVTLRDAAYKHGNGMRIKEPRSFTDAALRNTDNRYKGDITTLCLKLLEVTKVKYGWIQARHQIKHQGFRPGLQ